MKKYIEYTIEDFLKDDDFIQWVLEPDPTTNAFWESWMKSNTNKAQLVLKARSIILSIDFEQAQPGSQDFIETWNNIVHSIDHNELPKPRQVRLEPEMSLTKESGVNRFMFKNKAFYVAASIVILLTSCYLFFFIDNDITFTTKFGENKKITLPDGSHVTLNVNSTLSYSGDFQDQDIREVHLNGEAYFSIVHTTDHQKFVVHSNKVAVEVLGTEFNVNNRRGRTKVVLASGKVAVKVPNDNAENGKEEILLAPGEMLEFFGQEHQILKSKVVPQDHTGWREKRLVFKGTPLIGVIGTLEDNLGIKVVFRQPELRMKKYTGQISLENIEVFLNTISRTYDVEISEYNGLIIIE